MMSGRGIVCLQGGREFTADCREMDELVIARAGARVAVLAGAARVGDDYEAASGRARRHYEHLGAEVTVVPDPRTDPIAAADALDAPIDLLVLPGGSPSGLLDVLTGPLEGVVEQRWRDGMALSGASAGAMVLCRHMVRPDDGGRMASGLGIVEGLAFPHWSPGTARWPVPDDMTVWGLPECGGVLIDPDPDTGAGADTGVVAVGSGRPAQRRGGRWFDVRRG